jgi:hypothetical protein
MVAAPRVELGLEGFGGFVADCYREGRGGGGGNGGGRRHGEAAEALPWPQVADGRGRRGGAVRREEGGEELKEDTRGRRHVEGDTRSRVRVTLFGAMPVVRGSG